MIGCFGHDFIPGVLRDPDAPSLLTSKGRESSVRLDRVTPEARVTAFPETRWTLVLGASSLSAPAKRDALRALAEQYRPAILNWFRGAGVTAADAEDLSQEFVLDLLEGRVLDGFRRRETRFRAFLQACLRNFLRDDWRRRMAQKRGGGLSLLELDEKLVVAAERTAAERLDEEFVLLVHHRAVERTKRKWGEKRLPERFRRLEQFLFAAPETGDYEAAARDLATSVSVVKKTVFDLRQTYFQAVREQILQTVGQEQVAEELQYVVGVLSRLR